MSTGAIPAAGIESAVRSFFDEVWTRGDVSKVGDFLAEGFVSHNTMDVVIRGPDQYGRAVTAYRRAVPDLVVSLEDVFAVDDRLAVRGVDRGTHAGELLGVPGSGEKFVASWIEIFRIEGGKAVEGWVETDTHRLLEQLGSRR